MRYLTLAAVAALLAGCSNDSERIEDLENKIESLESQRAPLAAPAGMPASSSSEGASPAPTSSAGATPRPVASNSSASKPDENVCSDGQDRHLILVNRGEETMMYFYASPPAAGDWEEDILGDDVVSTGDRFRINFNSDARCTCTYDTRAMMADESEVIRKVNVCTDHTQTYP